MVWPAESRPVSDYISDADSGFNRQQKWQRRAVH